MPLFEGEVLESRDCGQGKLLRIAAPEIEAQPGQFAHVLCGKDSARTLRRPFSLMHSDAGSLQLLVKTVGGGSAWLAERAAGERVSLMAPQGRGFDMRCGDRPLLVAGGTGIAPLYFLARRLQAERGLRPKLLWGLNCGEDFGELPARIGVGLELAVATCDGSAGRSGTAIDLLEAELAAGGCDSVYACGPEPMLAALGPILKKYDLPCQVSVEQRMACGIGACYGCAVRKRGGESYLRACADGPVFRYEELGWDGEAREEQA